MNRGRPKRQPSGRNLELYCELVCELRPQAEVALRFRLSQPRVAQIRKEVAAWVENTLPTDAAVDFPADPGQRLHIAVVLRHLKLAGPYADYLELFNGPRGAAGYAHLLAAKGAGVLPPVLAVKLPPRQFVQAAIRMTRELEELGRIALRGPYLHLLAAEPPPT